ncbi:MAG: TonB-dependent receptor, partial [Bryobacteraceae bacterium]
VQQSLPFKLVLDVAYVGNHGVDSVVNYNLNAATVAGGGAASQPEYGFGNRTATTNFLFAGYSSSYNALQVKLDRRFAGGFSLTTAYTYGKGMAFQTGDDGGLYFYVNPQRGYARNDYDRTHTFVQSYVYDLPFGPGKKFLNSGIVANTLGGWRVTGILTLMTGTPFNVTGGSALNTPGSSQTADQVAPVQILNGIGPGNPWFSPTSFVPETQTGVFGNVGRNAMSGPGFFDLDTSLVKLIHIKERYSLEIRGEFFGVTNTPQFNNPSASTSNYSPDPAKNTFGVISGAGGGRTAQLGVKVNF